MRRPEGTRREATRRSTERAVIAAEASTTSPQTSTGLSTRRKTIWSTEAATTPTTGPARVTAPRPPPGRLTSQPARASAARVRAAHQDEFSCWTGSPIKSSRARAGRQLHKGEQLHALCRAIFYANEDHIRQRTPEQQSEQALYLAIVVNAIIACNCPHRPRPRRAPRRRRAITTSEIEHISPLAHQHIHLCGPLPVRPRHPARGAPTAEAPAHTPSLSAENSEPRLTLNV
jgi:hypothetical protein